MSLLAHLRADLANEAVKAARLWEQLNRTSQHCQMWSRRYVCSTCSPWSLDADALINWMQDTFGRLFHDGLIAQLQNLHYFRVVFPTESELECKDALMSRSRARSIWALFLRRAF